MGIWKETAAVSTAALLGLFLLPWALTQGPVKAAELPEAQAAAPPPQEETVSPAQAVHDRERTLRVLDGDAVREMTLADYLVGVTAAEMPASFEPEALKAQAVAARTYTLYKLVSGSNHGDTADICTDSTCCQAYISTENARANWGGQADAYEAKIREAVTATDGEAILYGGVPVKGGTVRSALGLRSACFDWELQDGSFVFYVTGYGHGVGLSQYGANAMAEEGADYKAILTHYYTGVTVEVYGG